MKTNMSLPTFDERHLNPKPMKPVNWIYGLVLFFTIQLWGCCPCHLHDEKRWSLRHQTCFHWNQIRQEASQHEIWASGSGCVSQAWVHKTGSILSVQCVSWCWSCLGTVCHIPCMGKELWHRCIWICALAFFWLWDDFMRGTGRVPVKKSNIVANFQQGLGQKMQSLHGKTDCWMEKQPMIE